ncbi:unnamed protein product [Taenia asiatica]|uniref:Uncharacterized protein n=1 Tax=Taenia asiatica TaxID=60517 RepID=A0A0R3WFQ6_TAEAS|nr:unnamed protein product [Taenia asiatica]
MAVYSTLLDFRLACNELIRIHLATWITKRKGRRKTAAAHGAGAIRVPIPHCIRAEPASLIEQMAVAFGHCLTRDCGGGGGGGGGEILILPPPSWFCH